MAGLTNKDGWCEVDMGTFESRVAKDVHVIGDACVAGAMPKSGQKAPRVELGQCGDFHRRKDGITHNGRHNTNAHRDALRTGQSD